jgi:hypothetical protein
LLASLAIEAALAGGARGFRCLAGFGWDQGPFDQVGQALEGLTAILFLSAVVSGDYQDRAIVGQAAAG